MSTSRRLMSYVVRSLHKKSKESMRCRPCHSAQRCLSTPSNWHGLWEPNDLKFEPDVPEYETINIQMKGYDYPVLESYTKFVHNAMDKIAKIDNDSWPMPFKSTNVRLYHPRSTAVNETYDIQEFERIVCIDNVPSTTVPLIVHLLQKHVPQGIKVSLKEPNEEEDSQRYVPDYDILELQAQKDFIESGRLAKKKK